jgi:hypothetical protein
MREVREYCDLKITPKALTFCCLLVYEMFMQTIFWADSRLSAFIILSLPRVHLHSPLAAFTCGDAGGGELAATSLVCYLNIHGFIIHYRCCA